MNKTNGYLKKAFIAVTAGSYVGITNLAAYGAGNANMEKAVSGEALVIGLLGGGAVGFFLGGLGSIVLWEALRNHNQRLRDCDIETDGDMEDHFVIGGTVVGIISGAATGIYAAYSLS